MFGAPKGASQPPSRGTVWALEISAPAIWRRVLTLAGLFLLELVICGLGTFFFGWSLLVALVMGGFGAALLEYLLSWWAIGDDFSSSVSWAIA